MLKPLARDERQVILKIEKRKETLLINNPIRNEEKRLEATNVAIISINQHSRANLLPLIRD